MKLSAIEFIMGKLRIASIETIAQLETPLSQLHITKKPHRRAPQHITSVTIERKHKACLKSEGIEPSKTAAFKTYVRIYHKFIVHTEPIGRTRHRKVGKLHVPPYITSFETETTIGDEFEDFTFIYSLFVKPITIKLSIAVAPSILNKRTMKHWCIVTYRIIHKNVWQLTT